MARILLKSASNCLFNGAILPDMDIDWTGGRIYGILAESSANPSDTKALMGLLGGKNSTNAAAIRIEDDGKQPAFLSKTPRFLPFLGGYGNLRLRFFAKQLTRGDIFAALEAVGLSRKERVRDYSPGMLSRLSLAYLLLRDASILLLNAGAVSSDPSGEECLREWLHAERACGKLIVLFFSCRDRLISLCDDFYHVQGSVLRKCAG